MVSPLSPVVAVGGRSQETTHPSRRIVSAERQRVPELLLDLVLPLPRLVIVGGMKKTGNLLQAAAKMEGSPL